MTALPAGWVATTLGDLALEVRNGISAKPDQDAGLPVLRISAVRPMNLDASDVRYLPAEFRDADTYALRTDDLLFTRYNGNRELVGACARVHAVSGTLTYPDKLIRVRLHTRAAMPAFIEAAACAQGARDFIDQQLKTSAGQVGVSGADLKRLPLPLAPLAEQQRIADKLDAVVARVDACRDRLARVTPLLKRFRQSVLAAATSGQLTIDWRGSASGHGGLRPEWTPASFRDVTSEIRYGTSKKCAYQSNGIGVLRIPNISSDGSISVADLKRSDFTPDELEALSLKAGDLLVIRSNGSVDLVGRSAVVSPREAGLLFAGYLIRIRVEAHKVMPSFAYLCLSCPGQRAQIEATAKSTSGVNNINSDELLSLRLQLPPLEEQAEIVRRVDTLFAFADRLEARLAKAQAAADRLTPALLAKAFRGELVPQDPADEPAAVLLQRLAASRPASVAKARRPRAGQGD